MAMTKSALIDAVAASTGLTRARASKIVNTIFETMAESLAAGKRIEMRGFGTFSVRAYDAYTGRNPRTGDSVEVGPKRAINFRAGKELRERVNGDSVVDDDDGDDDDLE